MGLLDPSSWSSEGLAQWTYDTLDPIYGQGGVLEPVAVVLDPDETIYETYIEPKVEDILDTGKDLYDTTVEPTTKIITYIAGFYLLTLALQR